MNVSAQVRYVDYSVRPLHSKTKRRSDEESVSRRKADPRPEDEPSDHPEREPLSAFDDEDEGLGYSRQLASRLAPTARKDMVPETVRPTQPLQGTAALLTLITAGDGRQHGVEAVAARPTSRGDAFYDLLDQVIAQA